jgi:hypothetical protein
MSTSSDLNLNPGCRDRLMIASSVACIVALFVSILGLTRSLFDVTWPLGEPRADRICLQIGRAESDQICLKVGQADSELPFSMRVNTAPNLTSRSPRPAAKPSPTSTPMPLSPTPVSSAPLTATIEITAQVVPSATTDHPLQAPILLSPEPDAQLQGEVHFQWQKAGQPLPEGLAFDLLIWSEAEHQEHQGTGALGIIETDPSLERDVDLDYVQTIIDHGGGAYFWTVIVVQKEPYSRVGAWGEKRPFNYTVPEPPAEPSPQSP